MQIPKEKALEKAAFYCSASERCIWDVKKKLEAWELTEQDCNEIIRKLRQEGFVDEHRYCRAYVNDKSKYDKWGCQKIRYELKKRNILDEIIQEALETIDSDANIERLTQLLALKRKSTKGKSEYEINQKLMRFAVGRGFLINDINKVLKTDYF